MKKLVLAFALLCVTLVSQLAFAKQICSKVPDGYDLRSVVTGYDNKNHPITMMQKFPRYRTECVWKYGAFAFNPQTRANSSVWNYDNADAAANFVKRACGEGCTAYSYSEDFSWVAMSKGVAWAVSRWSLQDAILKCELLDDGNCDIVWTTSSTADTTPRYFQALAFDPKTGRRAIARGKNLSRAAAASEAKELCATPDCWAYAFQGGAGAIAMSSNGRLWGAWSKDLLSGAANNAEYYCRKETGDIACKTQIASDAEGAEAELRRLEQIGKSLNVRPTTEQKLPETQSPNESPFVLDLKTRCKVFELNDATTIAKWSGACVSGKIEGSGTLMTMSKKTQVICENVGEMKAGLWSGRVVAKCSDGMRAEVDYSPGGAGVGKGTLNLPNGDKYEGEFKGLSLHGQGKLTRADGSTSQVTFANNELVTAPQK